MRLFTTLICLLVIVCAAGSDLRSSPQPGATPGNLPEPIQLVRAAVDQEVKAAGNSSHRYMFHSHKETPQGSQTRIYVETREAMAGMTIAYNDRPLTPDQQRGEENRLDGLVANPEQLRHKHSVEQENADRTLRIVKALPEALLYDYDGGSPPEAGKNGDRMVRLNFRPNPAYQPPSHVEQVLEGMRGTLILDATANRIARIDGTLFKEVSFGWGILGHLDKGGHFLVEQMPVDDGGWEISRMTLNFTGKILLVKSISFKSDEVLSDFHRVPDDTSFADGVKMLKAERTKSEQRSTTPAASRSH